MDHLWAFAWKRCWELILWTYSICVKNSEQLCSRASYHLTNTSCFSFFLLGTMKIFSTLFRGRPFFFTMTESLSSMNTLMFCCCFIFIWKNELYIFFFWKTFVPFSRYVSPVTVAARCISPFNILSSLLFVSTVKTNYNN